MTSFEVPYLIYSLTAILANWSYKSAFSLLGRDLLLSNSPYFICKWFSKNDTMFVLQRFLFHLQMV
jgi:hypothetical protein